MKITNTYSETRKVFAVDTPKGEFTYIEWYNDEGRVIDFQLIDKLGHAEHDEEFIKTIQDFIDTQN